MKHTKVKAEQLDTIGQMSMNEKSIISSIMKLKDCGIGLEDMITIKTNIDFLTSTMWTLFVLKFAEQTEENENLKKFLNEQLQNQLNMLHSMLEESLH